MGKSNEKSYREARKERLSKEQKNSKKRTPSGVRKKKIKRGIIIGVIIAVLALIITITVLNKTGVTDRTITAFEVSGEKFTIADYNYWYQMISTQVLNSMYAYPDRETVISNAFSIISVAKAATAKGYTLDGEELENYNATLAQLRADCEAFNGSDRKFFNQRYGFGTNEEIVMKNYKYQLLAIKYYNEFCEKLDYADEDLEKYYKEHGIENLDYADFKTCFFTADHTGSFKVPYKSSADALAAANRINGLISDEKSFDEAVKAEAQALGVDMSSFKVEELLEEDFMYNKFENDALFPVRDWLFSRDRKANDHTVITANIEGKDVYCLVFVVNPPSREDYKTVDMRHILISTGDGSTQVSDEVKAKAKAEIEKICAEWEETDMSDAKFAELAKKYSADTTAEDGGLIEKITKGQLVESIDKFLFEDNRKAGDYKIVESTYGYHLVYYKGTNAEKWKIDAENLLIDLEFEAESNRLREEHNITMTRNDRLIDMFASEQMDESIYYQ